MISPVLGDFSKLARGQLPVASDLQPTRVETAESRLPIKDRKHEDKRTLRHRLSQTTQPGQDSGLFRPACLIAMVVSVSQA